MEDHFSRYHPVVNFAYFFFVIGFSMFFLHPVYMIISVSGALIYSIILKGKKSFLYNLLIIIPIFLIVLVINPLFNHGGATILFYLKNGNPFTLESVVYGIASSTMLLTVILWFSCYNCIMTSDKFIYLFGRIIPSMSLVLSMVFRFVPMYKKKIVTISNAQKCIGNDVTDGNIIKRAKNGIKILSIMITWALESGIETSDSMKARGYGLKRRTAFSNFNFMTRDKIAASIILSFGIIIIICSTLNVTDVRYFPTIKFTKFSTINIFSYIIYFLLCYTPIFITIWEELKWKYLISKI